MSLPDINFGLDFINLIFLIITAIAVTFVRNLLVATILLSAFSLLMAAQYLILGAADVAITEAAVGAGISTILLLLVMFMVGDKEEKPNKKMYFLVPMIVVVCISGALFYSTANMPEFGSQYAPAQKHVAQYYIANSKAETGIPNIVTSILASYRGFDTLGETVVVLTAAIAILMLIGRLDKKDE